MSVPVAVGCIAATVVCGGVVLGAAQYPVAVAEASAASDAAALAAADALLGLFEREPCDLAGEVAVAGAAELVSCEVDASTLSVRITVHATGVGLGATASARAGPPDMQKAPS